MVYSAMSTMGLGSGKKLQEIEISVYHYCVIYHKSTSVLLKTVMTFVLKYRYLKVKHTLSIHTLLH